MMLAMRLDVRGAAAALVVLIASSACEKSTAAPPVTPSSSAAGRAGHSSVLDWYPLEGSAVWEYSVKKRSFIRLGSDERKTEKSGTLTDECLGPSPDDPKVVRVRRRIEERNPALSEPVVLVTERRLRVEGDSIEALSIQQEGHAEVLYDEPSVVFSLRLVERKTVQRIDALEIHASPLSQATRPVKVPFGNYPEAIERVTEGTVRGALGKISVKSGTVREQMFFARGVGPVKVERTLAMELEGGAHAEETMVQELVRFRG
jgi:hypothetical protein